MAASEPRTVHRMSTAADILKRTMNKLLGKKKAPPPEPVRTNLDAFASLTNSTSVSPTSPTLRKHSSRWKRSKKHVQEKPDLALPLTLPTQDDFRTSLLMPNLSARFSMLREQDDPRSKLGKASDDSVLQPRRRSRLMEHGFGHSYLGDIAEVQSINSSIRPPFANERQFSLYGSEDGYASENDPAREGSSMMSRARPGEGNIMFGGRQKVYKIAGNGSKGLGKAVYEDDINLSAFQQYRRKEREREQQERGSEDSNYSYYDDALNTPNDSAKDLSHSPSFSLEKKRSTASSIARSEARSSTAATSIHSQSNANGSSPRTAAAQLAHLPPPSLGALKRHDTKNRRLYEPGLDQHIQDQQNTAMARFNSAQRGRNLSNSGRAPPPVLHTAKSVSNLHEKPSQNVYAVSEEDSVPYSAPFLNLGSFGKFDTSFSSAPTSAIGATPLEAGEELTRALEPNDRGKATAMGAFNKPNQQFDALQYLERQQIMQRAQSRTGSHGKDGTSGRERGRSTSTSSARSRSPSVSTSAARSSNDGPKPYNLFHSAAARAGAQQSTRDGVSDAHRTFFGNISASEDEDEEYVSSHQAHSNSRGWQPSALPSVSEHPALRARQSRPSVREGNSEFTHPSLRPAESSRSLRSTGERGSAKGEPADSPTLGPGESSSQGLNSFVHHLRQRSNQSSIYPVDEPNGVDADAPEVPSLSGANLELVNCRVRSPVDGGSRLGSTHTHSNPWDLDDFDSGRGSRASVGAGQQKSRPSNQQEPEAPWQAELRKQNHQRDNSSSTQKERDAFANELAARRNAIQENIKSIVERDQSSSRGASPAPGSSGGGSFKPFGTIKSKSSRESMAARDAPSKAKQLLGMGPDSASSKRDPSLPRRSDTTSRFQHDSRSRYESDAQHPGKFSFDQPTRSRSNSARSRSRTGRIRDDYQKVLVEGLGEAPVRAPFEPTPRASPAMSPDAAQSPTLEGSSRSRSGSRPQMTHYFDAKAASASRIPQSAPSTTSITSANAPRSAVLTSQTMTPPVSGASTPLSGVFSPGSSANGMTATQYRSMPRRRTISKADISEPTLMTSTSNVDTVELPEGASLKNGMTEAPPLPPINPKRRLKIFGRGRGDDGDDNNSMYSAKSPDSAVPTSPEGTALFGSGVSSPDRVRRSSNNNTSGVSRF